MKTETLHGQRIRCYDNGGKTCDRYTVIYLDQPECLHRPGKHVAAVAMSERPFHPQGFGQHTSCVVPVPRGVGHRIPFSALPPDCQKLVHQDLSR